MATIREIGDYIWSLAPNIWNETSNGFQFGYPDAEATGVIVAWTPSLPVIEQAIARGANLIMAHEMLFWEQVNSTWHDSLQTMTKRPNIERARLLLEHGIAVYKAHHNWDAVPEHGVADSFPVALGLSDEISRDKFTRVYRIPRTTIADLAEQVKRRLGMPAVRVGGDLERRVTKVGTCIGGFGQMFEFPETVARQGAEVAIFGEMVDYAMRSALEWGMGFIETSHIASESPGMGNMARLIAERFPDVPVSFVDAGMPWQWR